MKDIQSSFVDTADTDDGDETQRYQYFDPDIITSHPPRFDVRDDPDIDALRKVFVANLAETALQIERSEDIETTVAIENVCARGNFEYLLVAPSDAEKLRAEAEEVELKPDAKQTDIPEFLNFTCDLGHAREPLEMVEIMESISSVHLHGTVHKHDEAKRSTIRERYGVPPEESIGTLEPGQQYQHLPPKAGDLPIQRVFDRLDEKGYGGPLVVEVDPQYRTPEVVQETVDYLRGYL